MNCVEWYALDHLDALQVGQVKIAQGAARRGQQAVAVDVSGTEAADQITGRPPQGRLGAHAADVLQHVLDRRGLLVVHHRTGHHLDGHGRFHQGRIGLGAGGGLGRGIGIALGCALHVDHPQLRRLGGRIDFAGRILRLKARGCSKEREGSYRRAEGLHEDLEKRGLLTHRNGSRRCNGARTNEPK